MTLDPEHPSKRGNTIETRSNSQVTKAPIFGPISGTHVIVMSNLVRASSKGTRYVDWVPVSG